MKDMIGWDINRILLIYLHYFLYLKGFSVGIGVDYAHSSSREIGLMNCTDVNCLKGAVYKLPSNFWLIDSKLQQIQHKNHFHDFEFSQK